MASSSKGATLLTSRLKYLYLAYLSRPVGDRAIYRTIRRRNVRKILEIGIGTAGRALRMIDLARRGVASEFRPNRNELDELFKEAEAA